MTDAIPMQTEKNVADDFAALCASVPEFARIAAVVSSLPLRRKPKGFATLLDAIVGQQVSTAAAAAIWARLVAAGFDRIETVADATAQELQACGLSRPKVKYALAIAQSGFDWERLEHAKDDVAIDLLCGLPGIGKWTAEIYALSALGRRDILPAGDLALQECARQLFGLDGRPTEKQFRQMGQSWAPYRSVAARALWAYYRVKKQRDGIR